MESCEIHSWPCLPRVIHGWMDFVFTLCIITWHRRGSWKKHIFKALTYFLLLYPGTVPSIHDLDCNKEALRCWNYSGKWNRCKIPGDLSVFAELPVKKSDLSPPPTVAALVDRLDSRLLPPCLTKQEWTNDLWPVNTVGFYLSERIHMGLLKFSSESVGNIRPLFLGSIILVSGWE